MPDGEVASDVLDDFELARSTLTGDVRDVLMDFVKHYKEALPFSALSETKQAEIVDRIDRYASQLVEEVVSIVAADGRDSMRFGIKAVGLDNKGEIVVKVRCPFRAETWNQLGMGSTVELIIADSRPFQGERKSRFKHITRDQASMFADENDHADNEKPVMDQTDAGKKLGGSPPAEVPAPELPKTDRMEVLRQIAIQAQRIAEHEELPPDEAIRGALKVCRASVTDDEILTIRKIAGFDDGNDTGETPDDQPDGPQDGGDFTE